jgi:hypothetical protein
VAGSTEAPVEALLLDGETWSLPETIGIAAGQHGVLATPWHLASAYAAAANGGQLMTPQLIDRIGAEARIQLPPVSVVFAREERAGVALQAMVLTPAGRMGLATSAANGQDRDSAIVQVAGVDLTTTPGAPASWQVAVLAAPAPTVLVVCVEGTSAPSIAQQIITAGLRPTANPK